MKLKEVLGIDASKLTLDCHLHRKGVHMVFDNNHEGITKMIDWALENARKEDLLFVFEHTGLYSHLLVKLLSYSDCLFHMHRGWKLNVPWV